MHIVNIMLSKDVGGIEQAFVDYTEGLMARGHKITAITHPKAAINEQLQKIGVTPVALPNFAEWDLLAIFRLRAILTQLRPDAVITHTGRSYAIAKQALTASLSQRTALVGVAHNYHKRSARRARADGVFAITQDVKQFLIKSGIPEEKVFHIPNMIVCDEPLQLKTPQSPPIIGGMGRLIGKKGFDVYIDAIKILRERGYIFKAILGGTGVEEETLKERAKKAGLADVLSMPGWLGDKKAFYQGIDIFCLPSLHEPFGIVLLEAFKYSTPVVATDSEGPKDIIASGVDGLIVEKNNAKALADALAKLIDQPDLGKTLATNAYQKVCSLYSIESVSERIENALNAIIAKKQSAEPLPSDRRHR